MPEFIPTDPLFANQWYLRNTGQTGFGSGTLDLNVTEVWPDYTGAGVTIAVYDNGVDYNHQDLNDNYDASQHVIIDGNPSDAFWLPPGSVGGSTGFNPINAHGTGMAGIAAAENNGVGSVGVAFDATLVGVYTPILGQGTPPSQLVQALQQLDNFDVALFASGGPTFSGGALNANWIPVYDALESAVTDGRGGLGTNILNSVHNNGPGFGGYDTNASQWDSSRFVTHVGGVNDEGVVVPNAVRSAAMHVSGFTGFQATAVPPGSPRNIIGTDITGADGAVPGDYASAGGTTSAVSQIAGVTALVLEANPDLGWRDVQSILVDAARHTGSAVGGPPNVGATETDAWEFNGAGDWNGGGRHYSIDYGYGIVDALAAVRLAETWLVGAPAATSANEASSVNPITPGNLAIPDNNGNSLTLTFNVTDDIEIESVQLRLGFNHARAQDLQIVVTSPDGTASTILHPITTGTSNVSGNGWRFNSQEFRGEQSAGTWTVTITDTVSGNTGSLAGNSALVFFGASDTTDDRYVYTNEFSDYAALPGRNTLADTDGGTDTINAAAVSGNSTIDLNQGATSTIAGQSMTIAAGSDIENAIGGDGDDILTGNDRANVMYGGRGNDPMTGGDGFDTAVFSGNLSDYTITALSATSLEVVDNRSGSPDGTDTITGFELARFRDQDFVITSGPNQTPVITSDGGGDTANLTIDENATAVTTVTAADADGPSLTFSIEGGADQARFTINPTTGALSFVAAPDFETPTDADTDNSYEVVVRASDGTLADDQTITVAVGNLNDVAPAITSNGGNATASVAVDENTTVVTTVTAADADGPAPTFSIVGGADQARFTINPTSGALTFVAAPDFEAPTDADTDNSYEVVVRASDGTLSDDQTITVAVGNVNDVAPKITSNGGNATASVSVDENTTAVTTVTSTDVDGPSLTFSIEGGADQTRFTINPTSGELVFVTAPDFETPTDADTDNSYEVVVRASDGTLSDDQAITVAVGNVNDVAPAITSNGGNATANASVGENTTAVTTVTSADADGPAPTFTIVGGADQSRFTLNPTTGALSFTAAPDFETPTDTGTDNSYEVVVRASDGTLTDDQAITVTVGNVNEAPAITSNGGNATASVSVDENTTVVTTVTAADADGPAPTFAIVGGADQARFTINPTTGALAFVVAPDFDTPTDADGNNSYVVQVRASDGTLSDDQAITVAVGNVNDVAPTITSNGGGATASVSIDEDTTAVTTVTSADADGPAPTFAIVGGADQARFTLNPNTGALAFVTSPDFAAPTDADGNNSYVVQVRASDGALSDDQTITVTVVEVVSGGADLPALGDVLWQHNDGTVATASHEFGVVGEAWEVVATGDFDADQDTDILWRHDDGLTVVWELEGGDYLVNHNLGIVGTAWQVAETADFDDDGDDDILWRHDDGQVVSWEMEDGNYVQNHNLASVPTNWEIAGVADFDGDGDDDIVWRHQDGQVVTWEMEDGSYLQNHNLPAVSSTWRIAGTGDFDQDGDGDILWRHDQGQVVTWEMEGGSYLQHHRLAEVPTNWQVAGTWDLDSDNDSDIVWRHNDGSVVTWTMEDGALLQTENFGVVSNVWQIQGTGQFDLA